MRNNYNKNFDYMFAVKYLVLKKFINWCFVNNNNIENDCVIVLLNLCVVYREGGRTVIYAYCHGQTCNC